MDIVACIDKNFVMPTGVMMYSVCVNNADVDIVFHVIKDESVTDKDRIDLEETVMAFERKTIVFYDIDVTLFPEFPNVNVDSRVTQASYYRLMLSKILPDNIDKILYLDGDVIVRYSLLNLWNTELGEKAIAAVTDMSEGVKEYFDRLNYPVQAGYFNSGVLLINLQYWREHNVVRLFIDFMVEHEDLIQLWDQDILNAVFFDKKMTLPVKYNLQKGFLYKEADYDYMRYEKEIIEARKDPVIVHYTGTKPWVYYSRVPKHPFASLFYKYQSQTKWKGQKTDNRSYRLRVINYIADLLRKYGLKSQLPPLSPEYIDIAPLE